MSANAYWIEAVSAALEEAGIEATSEQIAEVGQLLARDLQASQQQVAALREALDGLLKAIDNNTGNEPSSSVYHRALDNALNALTPTPEDAR